MFFLIAPQLLKMEAGVKQTMPVILPQLNIKGWWIARKRGIEALCWQPQDFTQSHKFKRKKLRLKAM